MRSSLLLSGGMDSIALAWWKRPDVAFTINYGQLAFPAELEASSSVCKRLAIEHHVIEVDCRQLGSGDMAGKGANINAPQTDWWPFRNQLIISVAAMKAIDLNVSELWMGTVKSDSSHKDGTQDFVKLISQLMAFQEGGLIVKAPAIQYSTVELVRMSKVPMEVLAWAHSCHKSSVTCGRCRGCNKYFEVLEALGNVLD